MVKLCLKKLFYELYLQILKISLHFPSEVEHKTIPEKPPSSSDLFDLRKFLSPGCAEPFTILLWRFNFCLFLIWTRFYPLRIDFSPPEVGTLSHQEFPYRVSLGLLYYYTNLETIFYLQKHRDHRLFWDQHKFLIYV